MSPALFKDIQAAELGPDALHRFSTRTLVGEIELQRQHAGAAVAQSRCQRLQWVGAVRSSATVAPPAPSREQSPLQCPMTPL